MAKTKVYSGEGGPITSQATLIITQFGKGETIQLLVYGNGESRILVDAILETIRETMKESFSFDFVS